MSTYQDDIGEKGLSTFYSGRKKKSRTESVLPLDLQQDGTKIILVTRYTSARQVSVGVNEQSRKVTYSHGSARRIVVLKAMHH